MPPYRIAKMNEIVRNLGVSPFGRQIRGIEGQVVFEAAEDRLRRGIVPTVSPSADATNDPIGLPRATRFIARAGTPSGLLHADHEEPHTLSLTRNAVACSPVAARSIRHALLGSERQSVPLRLRSQPIKPAPGGLSAPDPDPSPLVRCFWIRTSLTASDLNTNAYGRLFLYASSIYNRIGARSKVSTNAEEFQGMGS
jgi:hypothetical protein